MTPTDLPAACGDAPEGSPAAILDTEEGLDRVMGNRALYARMLRRFRAEYEGFSAALGVVLGAGETERAKRQAHTLKGAAGMIGACRVHQQAGALEDAIGGVAGAGLWQPELAKLDRELGLALRALDGALGDKSGPGAIG
ncbi:Hpt domain-containing protein [Massilia glaciei]|nr:Hpt domain-containing protein [Massilia glaciei]